MEKTLHKNRY